MSNTMTKWADYLISAVNYNSEGKIIQVKVHKDTNEGVGEILIVNRETLADNLKKFSYVTVYSGINTWKKGEILKVYNHDGNFFIRTDKNKVNYDNLGLLPEF